LLKVEGSWAKLRPSRKFSAQGKLVLAVVMLITLRLLFLTAWMVLR
jgi:hypothetical protein